MSGKAIDLTGRRFGKLTVMEQRGRTDKGDALWLCKCDCGTEKIIRSSKLRNGYSRSCGCYVHEYRTRNLMGQKFNRWTVLSLDHIRHRPNGQNVRMWKCQCECGTIRNVNETRLVNGKSFSCGCFSHERHRESSSLHGLSRTRLHRIWVGMKQRCNNPNDRSYKNYGGRGIRVCDEWENNFMSFYKWSMANGYSEKLSIDRIDNNKGYMPDNCRWADLYVQGNNKRNNRILEWNGEQKTIAEWSRSNPLNLGWSTIESRVESGWSMDEVFTTPLKRIKN